MPQVAARDNSTVADSRIHETVAEQPCAIAEQIPLVLCHANDNMQGDDIVCLSESMASICNATLSSLHLCPLNHICSSRSPNEC